MIDQDDPYEMLPPKKVTPAPVWKPPVSVERPMPCPKCGYDLRGIDSLRCPECGEDYKEAQEEKLQKQSEMVQYYSLRWIVYGVAPMLLWAPLAIVVVLLFPSLGSLAFIKMTGIVGLCGTTIWVTYSAAEENDWMESLMLIAVVFITTAAANYCIVAAVFSFLAGYA